MENHFENEKIRVSVERKPASLVRMEAHVTKEFVAQAKIDATKNIQRVVSLPGFRKGKVPIEMVQRNYPKEIEKQFEDVLKEEALRQAIALTNILPFTTRSVRSAEIVSSSSEDGASFLFVYEAWPVVPEVSIDNLETVAVEPQEVTDEEIEEAYRALLIEHATWEESKEASEKDGYVELDIDLIEAPAQNLCMNKLFWLNPKATPQWVVDAAIGMLPDESKDTVSVEGKQCRITLKKVKKMVPFEDEDALAKKKGMASDKDLRENLRNYLINMQKNNADETNRDNLTEEILAKYPIDLPETLLRSEVEARCHEVKQQTKRETLPNEFRALIEDEAKRFLSGALLLQPLASQLKIKIEGYELNLEMMRQAILPLESRSVVMGMDKKNLHERLFSIVMIRKVLDEIVHRKKQQAKT